MADRLGVHAVGGGRGAGAAVPRDGRRRRGADLLGRRAQYYATAELPTGSPVEVYEHTSKEFCAIRPPQGSFSWLPASAVEMIEEGVGEVKRDALPARVGSLMHPRRDVVHVRLDEGERVRVLAEAEVDGVRWLQIAPPAGEFRWIERSRISTAVQATRVEGAPPLESVQQVDQSDSGWVRAAAHEDQPKPYPATGDPAPTAAVTGAAPLAGENPRAMVSLPTPPPMTTAAPQVPGSAAAPLSGSFYQQMSALEIALSRQVAELPTMWRFETIEQQAGVLMTTAQTDTERAAVRDFAARVDRFASIANRYKVTRGLAPSVALTKTITPVPGAPRPGAPSVTPVDASKEGDSSYDAVGVLRPVVSKRPNAPQFALVDEQGKIVSFVTARPDLNLSLLIGKRVGVQGTKGFMPEYRHEHLTAGRVTPLMR